MARGRRLSMHFNPEEKSLADTDALTRSRASRQVRVPPADGLHRCYGRPKPPGRPQDDRHGGGHVPSFVSGVGHNGFGKRDRCQTPCSVQELDACSNSPRYLHVNILGLGAVENCIFLSFVSGGFACAKRTDWTDSGISTKGRAPECSLPGFSEITLKTWTFQTCQ